MTRDEAITQVAYAHSFVEGEIGRFVDSLVALGLLKLDEPKSVEPNETGAKIED